MVPDRHGQAQQVLAPQVGQHADYINPFELAAVIVAARGLPLFDIMLEAKAADLALLRLREDLRRYAPKLATLGWYAALLNVAHCHSDCREEAQY